MAVPETRLHPIYLIIGTAKTLRQAIPFLVVTIFGGAPWWVNVALFALVMVVAIAQWHVKKYSVVGGVLLLRSGLVNQSVRVVPITRITALAAFQSLTQRLVGVWGLDVQSPGDRNGSAVTLACLSGRRLDELRAALESGGRTTVLTNPKSGPGPSTVQRYLAWRRTSVASAPADGLQVIAVLTTAEMLIAAVTNSSISLILLAALVVWFRFSEYLPIRASEFMKEIVEPQGRGRGVAHACGGGHCRRRGPRRSPVASIHPRFATATCCATVVACWVSKRRPSPSDGFRPFVLSRDSGACCSAIAACRSRSPESGGQTSISACSFPWCARIAQKSLIRRALPELPWPSQPLLVLPARVHRRYLTLPLEYAAGFTLLMLFLPGWWKLLAVLPLPLGYVLGVARAREARWRVDDQSVVLRWRRLLNRNTVIAHRGGSQLTELSSSPWKAKAGVAGFKMRFSSGRGAGIRYMVDSDALLLLHAAVALHPVQSQRIKS